MRLEFKVVLISSNVRVSQDLKTLLDSEFAQSKDYSLHLKVYPTLPSVEQAVISFAPQLIILCIEPDEKEKKLVFLDHLRGIANRLPVIVSAGDLDPELLLTCLKKGVKDFIRQPFNKVEIEEMINRLIADSPINPQESRQGLTYSFFSYKGGIGTTFFSANTAVALARSTKSRVLLWDLVLQNGDIPFFFDYEPPATLTDLLEKTDKIDESFLKSILPPHSSGVTILGGPKRPEEAEGIRGEQVQALHQVLRKNFDYIIVDAGHVLTDQVIGVMDHSKSILLLTDLHLPVLKNTLRCLEVFERLGYVEGKFKIILNRYNSKYEKFSLKKAEEILGYPIAMAFTNDYMTASRSLNTGIPVADLDKEALITKQFNDLAHALVVGFKSEEEKEKNEKARPASLLDNLKSLFPGKTVKPKTKKNKVEEPSTSPVIEGKNAA